MLTVRPCPSKSRSLAVRARIRCGPPHGWRHVPNRRLGVRAWRVRDVTCAFKRPSMVEKRRGIGLTRWMMPPYASASPWTVRAVRVRPLGLSEEFVGRGVIEWEVDIRIESGRGRVLIKKRMMLIIVSSHRFVGKSRHRLTLCPKQIRRRERFSIPLYLLCLVP